MTDGWGESSPEEVLQQKRQSAVDYAVKCLDQAATFEDGESQQRIAFSLNALAEFKYIEYLDGELAKLAAD